MQDLKRIGEGIFLKIQHALNLYDPREAILELAKGKFTTDPARHSGEGIFFSSKVFDAFDIRSGRLYFTHDTDQTDILIERSIDAPGTLVFMQLDNDSPRTTRGRSSTSSRPPRNSPSPRRWCRFVWLSTRGKSWCHARRRSG